ncbi:MAG: TraK family protein [Nitrosomonas sp.]
MDYELSKRLIEIAGNEKKVNRRFNLAAFIILKPQIDKAIKDGWSIKFIWETLSQDKKVSCSYRTFLLMVKKQSDLLHGRNKDNKEELDSLSESKNMSKSHSSTDNVIPEDINRSVEKPELESGEDRIKVSITQDDPNKDYGNPKGFEWDTNFDPKDFV